MDGINEKLTRIIEYQEDIQRNVKEVLGFAYDELNEGRMDKILIICGNKTLQFYIPGANDRKYTKSQILWDVEQWKKSFIEDS